MKWSLRKRFACIGVSIFILVLAIVALVFVFSGAILNSYVKTKAELAFARAHPGFVLRLGQLNYSIRANRLVAESLTLRTTNTTLKADQISLRGVRWDRLLWGTATLTDIVDKASLDATNLDVEFPDAHYGIQCKRLRSSVPTRELYAEGTELRTLAGDKEFFAAHPFRTTRYLVALPELKISGVMYADLFQGKSYRAQSIQFSRPSFEALVNLDRASEPFMTPPLMLHEALAAIPQPLQIDSLCVTNGTLRYCEQVVIGADPAVLTIGALNLAADGIANRGESSAVIAVKARGNLMDAGMMNVLMSIPIAPSDFSFHYSGTLGAMELTNLDAFLDLDAHTRIKSGTVNGASFEIDVKDGKARGSVRANYQNLDLAFLDKKTGVETGLDNRIASFLANVLKIRSSNGPDVTGVSKEGVVNYTKKPGDEFQQFAWFALRTGVLDIISH